MLKGLFSKKGDGEGSESHDPLDTVLPIEDVHSVSAENSDVHSESQKDVDWGEWSVAESHNSSMAGDSFSKDIRKVASTDTDGGSKNGLPPRPGVSKAVSEDSQETRRSRTSTGSKSKARTLWSLDDAALASPTPEKSERASMPKKAQSFRLTPSKRMTLLDVPKALGGSARKLTEPIPENSMEAMIAAVNALDDSSESSSIFSGSKGSKRKPKDEKRSKDDKAKKKSGRSIGSRSSSSRRMATDDGEKKKRSSSRKRRDKREEKSERSERSEKSEKGEKGEKKKTRSSMGMEDRFEKLAPPRSRSSTSNLQSLGTAERKKSSKSSVCSDNEDIDSSKHRRRKSHRSASKSSACSDTEDMDSSRHRKKKSSKSTSSKNSVCSDEDENLDSSRHSRKSKSSPRSSPRSKKKRASKRPTEVELSKMSLPVHISTVTNVSATDAPGNDATNENVDLPKPLERRTSVAEEDLQRAEILNLQHQLSEALQKVVIITQEQIRDKDEFLKVSTELSQLKSSISDSKRERDDYKYKLERSAEAEKKSKERIAKLENAIERSLDEQDRLTDKLEQAEDDFEKLEIETKDLESKLKDSEGGSGDTEHLRNELKETKKLLVDKDREIEAQKHQVEHLAKELRDTSAVNKIQVDELDQEKKALEGKLKGERLDLQSKMTKKDETIATLQKELFKYKNDSEIQDMALVKAGLESAQTELDMARSDVERAERMVGKLRGEKEDLLERNNALNEQVKVLHRNVQELSTKTKDLGDKVLQWTEKTYDWKTRAEKAEKQLQQTDETYMSDSGDEGFADEVPQGLFLQSIMDKKANAQKKGRWGGLFNRDGADGEDTSGEAIRIKTLEERNMALEDAITQLRSEMIKLSQAHKTELYSSQKMVAQLQGENDALVLKNSTLELISARDD